MGRRSCNCVTVLLLLVAFVSCDRREHPNQMAWDVFYDGCVSEGFTELSANEDFDAADDIALIKDVCSEWIKRLTEDSPDALPDEISSTKKDEAFEEALDDCLDKGLLESEYC